MTRARRQRGIALLLAVMVVAVLTLTVFPFLYEGRVERAVATNLYTSLQARHLAEGGVVIAEALLRDDARKDQAPGQPPYDGLGETWAQFNGVPIAAGGGAASMVIVDEQSKLNVNRIVDRGTNNVNAQRRSHLERLLVLELEDDSLAKSLVEALIDRLDADDQPTGFGGAEESYYLGLTPPYKPARGELTTVAELGLVKGWTRKVVGAVAPFATVYGSGQVNANTAPVEVLRALGLDPSQAEAVLAYRDKTPLRQPVDIRQVPGLSASDANLTSALATRSNAFGVTVTGSFRDSVAIVRAVLNRGTQVERIYWRVE